MIGGVDEAGRGPVLGPLVVAGVVVENDAALVKLRVKDSKQLSAKRREELSIKIKEIATRYEIIIISASDIDDMRRIMTLNDIEVNAFRRVIEKLKPSTCYVDSADVNEIRFRREILAELSYDPTLISKHNADVIYPIVGAASILAKVTRDEQVQKIAMSLEKELQLPLGSGYPADPITMRFLRTWMEKFGELTPHVRHSWRTAQKLVSDKKTKKLDDF
jgi:ribonuclease HII